MSGKEPPEAATPVVAPATKQLYAQRARTITRELDGIVDKVQALAVDVDDPRDVAVLHLADLLSDALHHAKRLERLLAL